MFLVFCLQPPFPGSYTIKNQSIIYKKSGVRQMTICLCASGTSAFNKTIICHNIIWSELADAISGPLEQMLNLWDLVFITVYDLFIFLYIYYFRTASWWSLCGGVVTTATPNTFRPMKLHYAVLGPWTLKDLRPLPSEPASPWGNKWSLAQRKQTGEREKGKRELLRQRDKGRRT